MNLIVVVLKELVETVYRTILKLKSNVLFNKKHPKYLSDLKNDGISIIHNYLPEAKVAKYRGLIDKYLSDDTANVWRDEQGADERLYFINEIDNDFKEYYETPLFREVLKEYTGIENPAGMLLAGKIKSVPGNLGSGGGWHRDSVFAHQFKSICYLSDVNSDNGPFMYIRKSNNKWNILRQYFNRTLKTGVSRFSDGEIENYLISTKQEVVEVTASAGSLVLADTKGIHRGKPIDKGERYVVFCYFWGGDIPPHFNKLNQRLL
jgi:hypothetical protein